jgi:hypothetical protein
LHFPPDIFPSQALSYCPFLDSSSIIISTL